MKPSSYLCTSHVLFLYRPGTKCARPAAVFRPQGDEEGTDCGDQAAAAHHVGEDDPGRDKLRVHYQVSPLCCIFSFVTINLFCS